MISDLPISECKANLSSANQICRPDVRSIGTIGNLGKGYVTRIEFRNHLVAGNDAGIPSECLLLHAYVT